VEGREIKVLRRLAEAGAEAQEPHRNGVHASDRSPKNKSLFASFSSEKEDS
jgi:hypothetical protein